ncbi:GIY-YIG nuclease family protein [Yoonia litorea]|uniref:Putative endonuclease n=1 Tax=Yoonia litorea TaxID=1123755 RepID=A0A1I6LQD4_9RHOB|nr:GIY-YIG nuclease family protein [Yoonia litorea]SFS05618.1 putative endonuclease [Yoonia litorea]
MQHFVYIMASGPRGAIYIGRSRNLRARVEQHRAGLSVHTSRYKIRWLVWFEVQDDFATSLQRERALKRWRRDWKNQLIEATNPHWQDITAHIPI